MSAPIGLSLVAVTVLATPAAATPAQERAAILATVARMEAAWNRGDFAGYMAGVARMEAAWNRGDFAGYMAGFANPGVIFASGGVVQDGWQGTLDHYVRDYGASVEARGVLHFHDMTVDILAPDAAMLVGRYRLTRGARVTEGINTRLWRKRDERWVVTVNHVSARDVATPSAPAVSSNRPSN